MKHLKSGIYKIAELEKLFGNRMKISRLLKIEAIQRISQGVYATPDLVEDRSTSAMLVKKLYPMAIVSRNTALSFHDLYDYPGDYFHVDLPNNSGAIKNKGFVQFHRSKNMIGAKFENFDGIKIKVYKPERAVFEAVHLEPRMGRETREVVIKYMKRFDQDDQGIVRLMKYASLFGTRGVQIIEIARTIKQEKDVF